MNQDIFVTIEHLRGKVSDISFIMLAAAHALALSTGGKVVAIILGHDALGLAGDMNADQVLYADHILLTDFNPEAYKKVLAGIIDEYKPRAVFFGHTTIGMDAVGGISAQLGLPLISSVRSIETDGKLISQICGGKIMVECEFPEATTLITLVPGGYKPELGHSVQSPPVSPIPVQALDGLQTTLKQYIEPETGDVDITKEPLLSRSRARNSEPG